MEIFLKWIQNDGGDAEVIDSTSMNSAPQYPGGFWRTFWVIMMYMHQGDLKRLDKC